MNDDYSCVPFYPVKPEGNKMLLIEVCQLGEYKNMLNSFLV